MSELLAGHLFRVVFALSPSHNLAAVSVVLPSPDHDDVIRFGRLAWLEAYPPPDSPPESYVRRLELREVKYLGPVSVDARVQ